MLQDAHSSSLSSSPWWTVIAGAVGCALGAGVLIIYTFGVLASAMATEFGWSRTVYANSLTCFLVFSGLGSLLLGPLIDRFGVRRPAAVLVGLFGISITSLAWVAATPWAVYLIFAIIGVSGSAATAMPYAVAVRNQFDERRGLALGLINFGSGVGSALAPFCVKGLLVMAGWRGGFVTVGLAAAGACPRASLSGERVCQPSPGTGPRLRRRPVVGTTRPSDVLVDRHTHCRDLSNTEPSKAT